MKIVFHTQPDIDFNQLKPPPGYVPGLIRGDHGLQQSKFNYNFKDVKILKQNLLTLSTNQEKYNIQKSKDQHQDLHVKQTQKPQLNINLPIQQINMYKINKNEYNEQTYNSQNKLVLKEQETNTDKQIQINVNISSMTLFEIYCFLDENPSNQILGLEENIKIQQLNIDVNQVIDCKAQEDI